MTVRTRCRAVAAGLIAAAAAAAATANAAPAKAEPAGAWPDTTPPVIHIQIPESTADGWYKDPVEVRVTASDDYAVADIDYEITGAHTESGSTDWTGFTRQIKNEGVSTLKLRATDGSGNVSTREYGIGIDLTDPTVTFGGPAADGRVIRQGDAPTLTFTCADVPTVAKSCWGRVGDIPFVSGEDPVPTDTQGQHAVTVLAIDLVGRRVERQFTYTVAEPQLKINGRPSVSGDPGTVRVGDTLSATGGTFTPAATGLEYRWKVGGRDPVSGPTYVVRPDDVGLRVRLSVVGTRPGYAAATADATNDVPVATGTYRVSGPPTVTGTAREGGLLRLAGPATVTPEPAFRDNLWTVAGTTVETDSPALPLTAAHVGKRISCVQAYRGTGYDRTVVPCRFAGGATSVVVAGKAWTVRSPARLTGKAKVGKTLRAVAPALSGRADRYAYQWLRNGKVIKGATAAAYRPRTKDVKARISVRVTATTAHRPATVSVSPAQRVRR